MSIYGHCHYCKYPLTKPTATHHRWRMATRDHIVPVSRGGRETVPCCLHCNSLKADMMPEAWAAFMAANPDFGTRHFSRRTLRYAKAAARAEIFRQIRISKINPVWPDDIFVPLPPLCRGLSTRYAA